MFSKIFLKIMKVCCFCVAQDFDLYVPLIIVIDFFGGTSRNYASLIVYKNFKFEESSSYLRTIAILTSHVFDSKSVIKIFGFNLPTNRGF